MADGSESVIVQDPDILSGPPVFRGTRVPFQALLEYLEGGDTLDQFLEQCENSAANRPVKVIKQCVRNWAWVGRRHT